MKHCFMPLEVKDCVSENKLYITGLAILVTIVFYASGARQKSRWNDFFSS